jgi:DNA adenine methylase
MKYVGSKSRHYKQILNIILKNREDGQFYVEPFVGGFNVICHVNGNRIASDSNYYVIELFKAIQGGWIPPDYISEEEYKSIKNNKDIYDPWLVGFVGIGSSYSGKFFGGYARGENRNYTLESKRNILKQYNGLQGLIIKNSNYNDLKIPDNSIIYCDPPYENTTKYINKFDHRLFWEWILNISNKHNVFISEYNAPKYFKCVWEKEVNSSLDRDTGSKKNIEKLFTII